MNLFKTLAKKPLVGISACLLGKHVRYDGGHKLDPYLHEVLGKSVEVVPVCPETECGLGIPREAMQLEEMNCSILLMTRSTNVDITPKIQHWMKIRLDELSQLQLCGFIFKTKSPSCGLHQVEVFLPGGSIRYNGTGLFARGFMERFPRIPVEDESGLQDESLLENFIERIISLQRWYESNPQKKTTPLN